MSSNQNESYLLYTGDFTTPLYRDYFISHYMDPYASNPTLFLGDECDDATRHRKMM